MENEILKKIDTSELFKKMFGFFIAKISWLFLILSMILTAGCLYIWYFYIYHPEWGEEKKQKYVQTKEASIAFEREKFDKFIQETNNRQAEFQKDLSISSDIFRLKN